MKMGNDTLRLFENPCELLSWIDSAEPTFPEGYAWWSYWVVRANDVSGSMQNVSAMKGLLDAMDLQESFEDQSCEQAGTDVLMSGGRSINGIEPLAPVQFYPRDLKGFVSAVMCAGGPYSKCMSWTESESGVVGGLIFVWEAGTGGGEVASNPFDERLNLLLRRDGVSAKVLLMKTRGCFHENPRSFRRMRAWKAFGLLVDERVPRLEDLCPSLLPIDADLCGRDLFADLLPKLEGECSIPSAHHYFVHYLFNPYEPGYLQKIIDYWCAIGRCTKAIPADEKDCESHEWTVRMSMQTLRRYVLGGYLSLVLRSNCANRWRAEDNAPLNHRLEEEMVQMFSSLKNDRTSRKRSLSKWGVRMTEKGWAVKLSCQSDLERYADSVSNFEFTFFGNEIPESRLLDWM